MGFWNSFLRIWEIRTSIKIQEAIENSIETARQNQEVESNLPKIIDELSRVNEKWEEKLNNYRNNPPKS